MKNPYVIRFPNGLVMRGRDPGDLLDRITAVQYTKQPPTRQSMKEMLSDRAFTWSHAIVSPDIDDLDFMIQCAQAGLFTFTIQPIK